MDDESQIRELLLKEYAEAGQITRQHEQLTRTSVSVFLPTLLALAGYVVNSAISNGTKVVLAIGGLAVSLLVLNIVRRHQLYYRSYMARAHAIEASIQVKDAPVIRLYTLGKEATNGSLTISNKTAFSAFFVLAALFFAAAAVIYASHIICQVGA
jgi:hypothetical protein